MRDPRWREVRQRSRGHEDRSCEHLEDHGGREDPEVAPESRRRLLAFVIRSGEGRLGLQGSKEEEEERHELVSRSKGSRGCEGRGRRGRNDLEEATGRRLLALLACSVDSRLVAIG